MKPIDQVTELLGGKSEHRKEAREILREAEEVIEWRFDCIEPWRVLRLAKLLAEYHVKQRPVEDLLL